MKLSEILKDWPEKMTEGTGHPFVVYGFNAALASCDREIDREALAKSILKEWTKYDRLNVQMSSEEEATRLAKSIISTMPTWLKRIEG